MKPGKAPGTGNICTGMLKTDIHFACDLFSVIWTNDGITNYFKKALDSIHHGTLW